MFGNTFTLRNRPFYRYGEYIELIRFKEHYGMPREHGHDPIYSLYYLPALFRAIFHNIFLNYDCNGKKDLCAEFWV